MRHIETALITGASAGLGAGFARRLAARGTNVVLVARRAERLQELAAQLTSQHGVTATVLPADLSAQHAARTLSHQLEDLGIVPDALINSAGLGTAGEFASEDLAALHTELMVNIVALTELTRELLPALIDKRGVLVNVSSNAGFQPLPRIATYAASKAYVTALTEAIWKETEGSGVKVIALCPGPTETEFFAAAGSETFKVGAIDIVDRVLDVAMAAIDRERTWLGLRPAPTVIVGKQRAFSAALNALVPRRVSLSVTDGLTRKSSQAWAQRSSGTTQRDDA